VPLLTLVSGTFMAVLDTSIVNVAIPKMQVTLNAAPDDVEWIVTAYTLMMGVVVPVASWLGLQLGLTRLHRMVAELRDQSRARDSDQGARCRAAPCERR